ncbi:MAG: hypothetical protein ACP5L0_07535 [Caldisphaera sp.]|uniref:hypothetical protein n=1 Tax=Caldisphaera sp. TaxID=2060322 RepID=UPI003D0A744C
MFKKLSIILVILATLFGLFYAYFMFISGEKGVYGIYDIYGPLSREPLTALFLILTESLLLIASLLSIKESKKEFIFLTIYSIILITFLRYFWPDFSNYYYMTDFEDSFNHNLQATYITTYGHVWPNTFSSLQPGFWLTLAEIILTIFGKTSSITSPPFYYLIKWYTSIFMIISLPVVYITMRLYGLNERQSVIALIVYLIISSQFPYVVSNDYALIPYALSSGFFIKAIKSNEKKDYLAFFITFLFAIFNHQLISLWLSFGILGVSIILILIPQKAISKINVFYIFSSFIIAYLLRIIYASGNLLQQNFNGVLSSISSGSNAVVKLATNAKQSILITESIRALPAYTQAVRIKEIDYIFLLAIPFFTLLFLSITNKKIEYKILFLLMVFSGLIAALQVVGMGGVGWADRLPKDLLPMISFAFSLFLFYNSKSNLNKKKIKGIIKSLGVSFIIIASALSLFATFAGYATVAFPDSQPFGEAGVGIGITNHTSPNFNFYYYVDFSPPFLTYNSSPDYYEFAWSYFIYGVYAYYPNATYLLNNIYNVTSRSNIILMTPTDFIFQKYWP